MKRRFFALLFCLVMLAAVLSVTVYADDNTVYIDTITITGLEQPYGGDPMDETYTVKETEYMDKTGIVWFDINKNKYVHEDYITGHQYFARVWVNLKSGYAFSADAKFCIDGKWYTAYDNYGNGMDVKVTFDVCQQRPHTHTPSSWKTDKDSHYKVCTGCDEELERADHKGGKATCAKAGKCTVCGYAYIEKIKEHTPGPAATEKNPQKCTVCGYVIAKAIGSQHTHSLKEVAEVTATCTEAGTKAYYACSGCDLKFSDADGKKEIADKDLEILPLGHQASDGWEFDDDAHWHICTTCNSKLEGTGAEHELQDDQCVVCDYGTAPKESGPVSAEPAPQPQKTDKSGFPGWVFLVIAGGIVVAAGAGGFLLLKKRK